MTLKLETEKRYFRQIVDDLGASDEDVGVLEAVISEATVDELVHRAQHLMQTELLSAFQEMERRLMDRVGGKILENAFDKWTQRMGEHLDRVVGVEYAARYKQAVEDAERLVERLAPSAKVPDPWSPKFNVGDFVKVDYRPGLTAVVEAIDYSLQNYHVRCMPGGVPEMVLEESMSIVRPVMTGEIKL
jgi:hypothetical protein